MAIGNLRHRVTIQSPTRSAAAGGGGVVTWSEVATVFASIEPTGGNERVFGDQNEGVVTHKIMMRFRRDVSFKNRITYARVVDGTTYTQIFNIKRVMNEGSRDFFLHLLVEEGVAT